MKVLLKTADKYQDDAVSVYNKLSIIIVKKIPKACVEHIGSSSIKNSVSKGDLDVYVAVEQGLFKSAVLSLLDLGFYIKQDTLRTDELCAFVVEGYGMDVGVQLVVKGSKFELFTIFRDRMNASLELRNAYNTLKKDNASKGMDLYRKAKSDFINMVLG